MPRCILILLLAWTCSVRGDIQPWDRYNLSPDSRLLHPSKIRESKGSTLQKSTEGSDLIFPVSLCHPESYVLFDFERNVAGWVALEFGTVPAGARVGLTFSESTNYASCPSDTVNTNCNASLPGNPQLYSGDDSKGSINADGAVLSGELEPNTTFHVNSSHLRGGFRYLNVFLMHADAGKCVEIESVNLKFTAAPEMSNLRDYKNHFYSSDELVNRIWYAAAYTVQLCTVSDDHGRAWPPPLLGWNNGVKIGVGGSIIVDGAKRDRTIWPGDLGISLSTAFATLGDYKSGLNSLTTLYSHQSQTGQLPYVGPAVFCQKPQGQDCKGEGMWSSDTYHLWGLIGTRMMYSYSKNITFAKSIYVKYKMAVEHSLNKIGKNGLFVVDKLSDWQRGGQGGENIAANALLYKVTQDAVELATVAKDTMGSAHFKLAGQQLKERINALLWNKERNAYRDNPTSNVYPQDGNSLTVWFNVTKSASQKENVLGYLRSNWGERGAISPEWKYQGQDAIGTFPSSMEVFAWLSTPGARNSKQGIELIKRTWGYMLGSPNSTNSTFWEGFQADGQFAFRGVYMSHAHGWATGPAPALTYHILGIRPGTANYGYEVQPAFDSGLAHCDGSLSFAEYGRVRVSWRKHTNNTTAELTVDSRNYNGPIGLVGLPSVAQIALKGDHEKGSTIILWQYGLSQRKEWPVKKRDGGLWLKINISSQLHFTLFY